MNVEIEETGPVERKLRVEIPTADVDAAFDGVYRVMRRQARIPGFRPGRAPRSVMERYFGDQARGEVLERLVRDSLPKAVEEAELAVIGEPQLHPAEPPQQGEPFSYEATLDVRPEIELKSVRGLKVTRPALPEPEQDPVDEYLEELRVEHAQVAEEEDGVTAARGHQAVIEYEATVDGEPFEGGSGQDTLVDLGEGRAIPGLEDELLGMTTGQEREFELELPASYPAEAVAGRTARFRVRLVGLKRRELPELDDEFAVDVSNFDTLDELRSDLFERIEAGRKREAERLLREALLTALLDANSFPIPQTLVERQLGQRIARAANQLQKLPEDELGKLVEAWREEWRPRAERDVRLGLLLPEIARAEDIEVSTEDVDAELRELAEQQQQPLSQLKRRYKEQGVLEALRASLLERRVVDFLVSEATVSDG